MTWPLPSKVPDTPIANTVGYRPPLTSFTGRFLDSTEVGQWRRPMRTLRAQELLVRPDLDALYVKLGGGVLAKWRLSTFFSRLAAGEPLAALGAHGEQVLAWDGVFNVDRPRENQPNIDGDDRLGGFDVDDRGNVYVAGTIFGWWILDGSMAVLYHGTESPPKIVSLKGGGKYYALVSGRRPALYDVTAPQSPVRLAVSVPQVQSFAKSADASLAATINGALMTIIGAAGDVVGTWPGYVDVTGDGSNFYALSGSGVDVFAQSGNTYAVVGTYQFDSSFAQRSRIHYGDGHVVLAGVDAGGAWDLRVYKVDGLVLTPVMIEANPASPGFSSYFRNYYNRAPDGFLVPENINMNDGAVVRAASGKAYLVVCAKGLGDVYELAGATVAPPVVPPVVPPTVPPTVVPPPSPTTVPTGSPTFAVCADRAQAAEKRAEATARGATVGTITTAEGAVVVFWF